MKILCVIPARYASTRLPGKPLADIDGMPMVARVLKRAQQAKLISEVVVAVDDARVQAAVEQHGGRAIMTAKDHPTGTDRLAEVAQAFPDVDVIINIQGDEPLINPEIIDALAMEFDKNKDLVMATVKTPMLAEEYDNPNNVKVVTDKNDFALYFSRSLMPYPREKTGVVVYKHIGIYGYSREFLLAYAKMAPTILEQTESLEQLRALENGYKIKVITSQERFVGVDTAEDLAKVNEIYKQLRGVK